MFFSVLHNQKKKNKNLASYYNVESQQATAAKTSDETALVATGLNLQQGLAAEAEETGIGSPSSQQELCHQRGYR